ncbi:hypothetical protein LguiB_019340 [Lonicera macranthoides]
MVDRSDWSLAQSWSSKPMKELELRIFVLELFCEGQIRESVDMCPNSELEDSSNVTLFGIENGESLDLRLMVGDIMEGALLSCILPFMCIKNVRL